MCDTIATERLHVIFIAYPFPVSTKSMVFFSPTTHPCHTIVVNRIVHIRERRPHILPYWVFFTCITSFRIEVNSGVNVSFISTNSQSTISSSISFDVNVFCLSRISSDEVFTSYFHHFTHYSQTTIRINNHTTIFRISRYCSSIFTQFNQRSMRIRHINDTFLFNTNIVIRSRNHIVGRSPVFRVAP